MEIHEFYIPSSSGIANLHCMEWIPSGEVKAIVQIAHGMMEHVGRYREFAEFLAGHGIYVLGNDHLGHGKTAAAAAACRCRHNDAKRCKKTSPAAEAAGDGVILGVSPWRTADTTDR